MSSSQWTDWKPYPQPDFQSWGREQVMGRYWRQLQSNETKICYISPDGQRRYWLAGDWAGNRGVALQGGLQGVSGSPFEQKYTSGPYMLGESLDRTDYGKRAISLGVHIAPHLNAVSKLKYPNTNIAFRMLEQQWWQDWPEHHLEPMGFWGEFTRFSGWRWARVRLGAASEDRLDLDPQAFDNNIIAQSMTIHAPFPFYSKNTLTKVWENNDDNVEIFGKNRGILRLPNRGDYPQWPKFIVEGDGEVTIQDGVTDRMVELPRIFPGDGMILVDTDPSKRTLTSEHDPIDTPFYKLIRNSEILDFLLGDLTQAKAGEPIGMRMEGGIGFSSQIPARTMGVINVTHSNPHGKITMILPQWYRRGVS